MNLRNLRKERGIQQRDIAQYLGITQTAYCRYESGQREPSIDTINKIATYYGVTVDEILGRGGPSASPCRPIQIRYEPKVTEEVKRIPIVGSVRCGWEHAGEPAYFTRWVEVPKALADRHRQLLIIEAVGKSMEPTILQGDLLYVTPGDGWKDGDVVVAVVEDDETVKRIRRSADGGIDLTPDNPSYRVRHYSPEDIESLQIAVVAKVVQMTRVFEP